MSNTTKQLEVNTESTTTAQPIEGGFLEFNYTSIHHIISPISAQSYNFNRVEIPPYEVLKQTEFYCPFWEAARKRAQTLPRRKWPDYMSMTFLRNKIPLVTTTGAAFFPDIDAVFGNGCDSLEMWGDDMEMRWLSYFLAEQRGKPKHIARKHSEAKLQHIYGTLVLDGTLDSSHVAAANDACFEQKKKAA
jgi:hypothetical protein